MLSAFGRGAGGDRPVEGPADLGGGGGQAVQHGPPPGQVPGGWQLVERTAGGVEQSVGCGARCVVYASTAALLRWARAAAAASEWTVRP